MQNKKEMLIITEPNDIHANAVTWGLSQMGYIAHQWILTDFPSLQRITIKNLNTNPLIAIEGNISLEINSITTIWNRRTPKPIVPAYLNRNDIEFVKRECSFTIMSVFSILKETCPLWVNPSESTWINNKVAQLRLASAVSFDIPKTIVSNNPNEIKSFFTDCEDQIIFPYDLGIDRGDAHSAYGKNRGQGFRR